MRRKSQNVNLRRNDAAGKIAKITVELYAKVACGSPLNGFPD